MIKVTFFNNILCFFCNLTVFSAKKQKNQKIFFLAFFLLKKNHFLFAFLWRYDILILMFQLFEE